MEAIVEGVRITLTPEQVMQIEAYHAKQKQECSTFTKTLKHFGFKKMSTKGWENPDANCYQTKNWFAQIYDSKTLNATCFIVGEGIDLDSSGWPLVVDSPEELVEILNKALEEIENGK